MMRETKPWWVNIRISSNSKQIQPESGDRAQFPETLAQNQRSGNPARVCLQGPIFLIHDLYKPYHTLNISHTILQWFVSIIKPKRKFVYISRGSYVFSTL